MLNTYCDPPSRLEIRALSMFIGIIQSMWSLIPLLDMEDKSLFAKVIGESGVEVEWCFSWLAVGILLMITSVIKWRNGRYIALFFSSITAFATFSIFINYSAGPVMTPISWTLPVIGLFSFGAMIAEAARRIDCGNDVKKG